MTSTKSALVCIAPGFEEVEFTVPVDILRRGGVDVKIASVLGMFISSVFSKFFQPLVNLFLDNLCSFFDDDKSTIISPFEFAFDHDHESRSE